MKVYYSIDEQNRVHPCCDWSEDIVPDADWHVGEINGAAYESHGVPIYKEVEGVLTPRTEEEIQTDVDLIPVPEPPEAEQLRADVDYLTMENEYLEGESEQARADIDYLLMLTEEE